MKLKLLGFLLLGKLLFFPPMASCQQGGVVIVQPPAPITWNATMYTVGGGTPSTTSPTIDLAVTPVPTLAMSITATGGVAPYTYSIKSGTAPPGLTLNTATGIFSGTPTVHVAGDGGTCTVVSGRTSCSYSVTLQVRDSLGTVAQREVKWEFIVATAGK